MRSESWSSWSPVGVGHDRGHDAHAGLLAGAARSGRPRCRCRRRRGRTRGSPCAPRLRAPTPARAAPRLRRLAPEMVPSPAPAVTASIRRMPWEELVSRVTTNGPISAVERTCVPPHSSRLTVGISTTRTCSPYFSPKSIIAPSSRAWPGEVTKTCRGWFSRSVLVHDPLHLGQLVGRERGRVAEVEPQLVGADVRARLGRRGRRAARAARRAAGGSRCGWPSWAGAPRRRPGRRTRSPR